MEVIHIAQAGDGKILVTYMLDQEEFAELRRKAEKELEDYDDEKNDIPGSTLLMQ